MAKPREVTLLAKEIESAFIHISLEMVERAYQKAQEFAVEKIDGQFSKLYLQI